MAQIIYPPRPRGSIPSTDLGRQEATGLWCIQPKYEGSRCVISINPAGKVEIYSRHGRAFRDYTLPTSLIVEIRQLPGLKSGIQYWLDGELLIKTTPKDTKGKIVLFDILQADRYLFLKPDQMDRYRLLDSICGQPRELDPWRQMAYLVSNNLMLAPLYESNFLTQFEKEYGDEVKGIVLRKKSSVLDNFGLKEYLVDWLVRCRKPTKSCSF